MSLLIEGMNLYYTVRGQVQITIIYFLDKVLTAFDKAEPKGVVIKTSAAPENLFKVDVNGEKLPHSMAVQF